MGQVKRRPLFALLMLALAAVLTSAPVLTQPARPATPPDISGEWRLENNEEDTTAQPPLGEYLGIPFNEAGRLRSDTTAESIWGTPEYQCRPALGAAPVARSRRRAHPQGAGSAHARGEGLPHPVHAIARPSDLHGRPAAPTRVRATQLDRASQPASGSATR
jgi:hypothetical protein